jgi:CBS domain-containing protein
VNELPLPVIEPDLVPAATNEITLVPTLEDKVEEATELPLALEQVSGAQGAPSAPDAAVDHVAEVALAAELVSTVSKPISDVMDQTLWTVHAEDSIDKVETLFASENLTSAPVVGSNGAIIGMIGAAELAAFHAEGKNARAVQAWEISRIKTFEVNPTDTVEDVAKLMTENKVENISVTEFGRLKGVVSSQDLLQELLNVLPADPGKT